MKKIVLISSFALFGSWGCVSSPDYQDAVPVQEVGIHQVKKCDFVGVVHGQSSLGGGAGEVGILNAKAQALESVSRQDGTHVVWKGISANKGTQVIGEGYKCKMTEAEKRKVVSKAKYDDVEPDFGYDE